jgi:hypothetical protein
LLEDRIQTLGCQRGTHHKIGSNLNLKILIQIISIRFASCKQIKCDHFHHVFFECFNLIRLFKLNLFLWFDFLNAKPRTLFPICDLHENYFFDARIITPKPLMNEGNLKINSEGTYSIVNR